MGGGGAEGEGLLIGGGSDTGPGADQGQHGCGHGGHVPAD
jgi:hypothetical protein